VANFTLLLYFWEKEPPQSLNWILGGPHSQSRSFLFLQKEEKFLNPAANQTNIPRSPSQQSSHCTYWSIPVPLI